MLLSMLRHGYIYTPAVRLDGHSVPHDAKNRTWQPICCPSEVSYPTYIPRRAFQDEQQTKKSGATQPPSTAVGFAIKGLAMYW